MADPRKRTLTRVDINDIIKDVRAGRRPKADPYRVISQSRVSAEGAAEAARNLIKGELAARRLRATQTDPSKLPVPLADGSTPTELAISYAEKALEPKKSTFAERIERQGGWGLSDETLNALGANVEGPLGVITGGVAGAADLGYRVLQGAQAGLETGAEKLDDLSEATGLADALSFDGNKFLPGSAVMALGEAFPGGGIETGILPTPRAPAKTAKSGLEAETILTADGLKVGDLADIPEIGHQWRGKPETGLARLTDDELMAAERTPEVLEEFRQRNRDQFGQDPVRGGDIVDETPDAPDATPTPEPVGLDDSVVSRLTESIKEASKLSRRQAEMLSESRAEKLKGVFAARNASGGEAGLRAELSQLKGQAPKVDYEGVRGNFSQDEIDGLFDALKTNPELSVYDSINARTGLAKLLDGTVPSKSEVALLAKVFPSDFVKTAMSKRKTQDKLLDIAGNALNLPRSLMSSLDLSAPLRQGVFMVGRKEFYSSFASMFKQFGSEKAFNGVMESIKQRRTFPLMEESGLSLTDLGHTLSNREEAFMSNWAEKIPVIGRGVRASERGFTGFLNKLRADSFDDIVRKSEEAGIDFDTNPKALKDIASFVNAATGRGSLGALNSSGPALNALFFSPRLMASRVTLLNPQYYAQLSPVVRKEAVKSLLSFGALATGALTLAKMGGADVEIDPRSSDFGKIKVGNTRYDILGGFGQYVTLASRLATNQTKTIKGDVKTLGEGYGSRSRKDVAENFLENKFAPIPGYIRDYLHGKDPVGNEFEFGKDTMELFIPLLAQDVMKAYDDEGALGAAKAAPGFFGVGVQTYSDGNEPVFDPTKAFTEEGVAGAPAGLTEASAEAPASEPVFDPTKDFETTTEGNLEVKDILEGLGARITDEGVRDSATQARLYNSASGVAKPGTSPHEDGNAIDIGVPSDLTPEDIEDALTDAGYEGVKVITRKHGTGPHWHIQWR